MDILDGDDVRFFYNGVYAERDIVQVMVLFFFFFMFLILFIVNKYLEFFNKGGVLNNCGNEFIVGFMENQGIFIDVEIFVIIM